MNRIFMIPRIINEDAMDGPNLNGLRESCSRTLKDGGRLHFKYQKAVVECWDGIARVAAHYWQWINKPWTPATPKQAEKEWEKVRSATNDLMSALRQLSAKSFELAIDLNEQVSKKKPRQDITDGLHQVLSQGDGLAEKAWLECDGSMWFLEHMPREVRRTGPTERLVIATPKDRKRLQAEWNKVCDGDNIGQLHQVQILAQYFSCKAAAIKNERAKAGFGGTWAKDEWQEDPIGAMSREVQSVLLKSGQPKTYTNAIALEIHLWAHPDLPEEKWPSPEYFAVRRLK